MARTVWAGSDSRPPPARAPRPGASTGARSAGAKSRWRCTWRPRGTAIPGIGPCPWDSAGWVGSGPVPASRGLPPLGLDRLPSKPPVPVEPPPPYQPPPEIPDIEMIFAATPDLAKLRDFVLPLGIHKQHADLASREEDASCSTARIQSRDSRISIETAASRDSPWTSTNTTRTNKPRSRAFGCETAAKARRRDGG